MNDYQRASRRTHSLLATWGVRIWAVLCLAVLIFAGARPVEAKLDPYYVLRGQSLASFKPRVLIAMDTSGSMTWTVGSNNCAWGNCEDGNNNNASRIALARRAIHEAISQAQGQADFAFMTFDHYAPPTSSGQVPDRCRDVRDFGGGAYGGSTQGNMGDTRFFWVNRQNGSYIPDVYGGNRGTWSLCGRNRPFPYLRWDDAIFGVTLPNDATTPLFNGEAVPDAPLAPKVAPWGRYSDARGANRRVQFFPRFAGQRVRIDCADADLANLASNSYGDYGNGVGNNGQVCNNTWYYWPYVDGFPSYSYNAGYSDRMGIEYACSWGSCSWYNGVYLGVAERSGQDEGTLWAPFYSEAAQSSLSGANKGPTNRDRANATVLGMTDTMAMGGVDADGGTPLVELIGNVDTYVNTSGGNITGTTSNYVNSNGPFQHENMASYLSFIRRISPNDVCVPTFAIIISDGEPNSDYGLYSRLSKLRRKLDVKTYSLGFGGGVSFSTINNMACAAAGSSNNSYPCSGSPSDNWDTCRVPGNPSACGYQASNPQELADALFQIIDGAVESELPAGPVASTNDFLASTSGSPGDPLEISQTDLEGFTESPEFKGHVVRSACDTQLPVNPDDPACADPNDPAYAGCATTLADYCVNATKPPPFAGNTDNDDAREKEDFALGGTTCTFSREWDAGVCLQQRNWRTRRVYTYDASGNVFRISTDTGSPTPQFSTALLSSGAAANGAEVTAITQYILGKGLPDNWKLPGLATSTPVVVRRIPPPDENFLPSVAIRDPHCAGRQLDGVSDVPQSLRTFAEDAETDTTTGAGLAEHRRYQEAVLVGSDFGLLHAFHFDSGNELFALLPPSMYQHIADLQANGVDKFGQSEDLANHEFGIAATLNQGWAFDEVADKWRHLVTVGMGPGGRHLVTMDVSHMGDLGPAGASTPVEVLWTTETMPGAQGTILRETLGETWSRPALIYKVPDENLENEPRAYLVFASGYDELDNAGQPWRGQAVHLVDAITGRTNTEVAYFPQPAASQMLEDPTDYAITMDPAVGTHCLSHYWAEAQETYIADVAGNLYRWDLGTPQAGNGQSFDHVADSGAPWSSTGNVAQPLFRFGACLSTNEYSCSVSSTVGDHFIYPPAVIASDRIDEPPPAPADVSPDPDSQRDEFLLAMISGSMQDDKIDGGDATNPFHSSLYIMVDEHRGSPGAGLSPTGAAGNITPPGVDPDFMRIPLNAITRTRNWTYADGSSGTNTRAFSKKTRPVKPPFIRASLPIEVDTSSGTPTYDFYDAGGASSGGFTVGQVELYEIVFTVYEPGEQSCDPRWQNPSTKEWEFDAGSTYEIAFFLAADDSTGFDLVNGAGIPLGNLFGGGSTGGLSGPVVRQSSEQGFRTRSTANVPCDPLETAAPVQNVSTVPVGVGEVDGFSPREI